MARLNEQNERFFPIMLINGNSFLVAFLCALSRAESLRSHFNLHYLIAFNSAFLNIHRSGVFTGMFDCYMAAWCYIKTAAVIARSVHTIQPCTTQSRIRKVHECLAVTCQLGELG